jgi:PAS domain S-box-containing protein
MDGSSDSHFQSLDDIGKDSQWEQTQQMPRETSILRSINIEHVSHAFVALDQQWRVMYFSHQAAQLMQRTREEVTGKNLWEAFPELMASPFYHHCQQAASSDKAAHIVVRSPHFQKWFHIHIFPSPGEIGIFFTDITKQKKAEEQLGFQADILRNVRDSVIVTDLQGKISYWNAGATSIFGYSPEEMINQSIATLYTEIDESQLAFYIQHIIAGQAYAGEWKGHRKDGTVVWVDRKTTPMLNRDGEVCGFIGVSKDITERKHAEELAKRSERRYRALIENSVDAIALLDIHGNILYSSPSTIRILGYLPEELDGYPAFELLHPDDLEQFRHIFTNLVTGSGRIDKTRFRVRHKDGTIRWVSGSGLNLLHDQYVAAIVVNYHDITDSKHAIEERQKLAAIVKSSDDAIIGTTIEGIIMNWNKGAERIYGYTQEEVIGKSITLLYPPGSEDEYLTLMQRMMKGEITDHFETLRRCKDGTIITVSISVSPIKDVTGAFIGSSSIARDITKQKRLEAEVQRTKQQLEVIFQNIADGIIVEDASGKIIYANTTAATLAGYTSVEETLTSSASTYWEQFDITDDEGLPFPLSRLPGNLSVEGNMPAQANLRLLTKCTGEVHWTSIKSTAVFDADQTLLFVISVLQDITQFKALEQHKDEFVMHVSHELRTPLTAVSGYLELLLDHNDRLQASKKMQFLHQALENCYVLADLVNTIIDVLKINYEVKPGQPEVLSVASIVREVIEQFDPRKRQEYTCRVDVPEDLVVFADKQYFCQVLRNLIANAFKYTPKQTPVIISALLSATSQEKDAVPQVRINVQDAGPGIPPAEQPLLFHKFVRLKRDLTSAVRGTGLGLYICKELVERMGGRIWVESPGKDGVGSCFSFTLPVSGPPGALL